MLENRKTHPQGPYVLDFSDPLKNDKHAFILARALAKNPLGFTAIPPNIMAACVGKLNKAKFLSETEARGILQVYRQGVKSGVSRGMGPLNGAMKAKLIPTRSKPRLAKSQSAILVAKR